jgi:hypothetical protein
MTSGRTRFERLWWWSAFAAFVVTGVGWTMAMPLLAQPDEPSHAIRAAAIAQGELTWKAREEFIYEEFFFVRRTNTVVDVPEGYATLEDIPVCFTFESGRDASCASEISSASEIIEARPYTGTYPPLTAVVQSPGGHFDAPVGLVVMRLCTVVVTAALLASGVVAVRRLGGGANAVGFALVLTPVTISIMAAINPSALELAAAACLWPSLIDVLRAEDVHRRSVWRAVIAATVLILSRPISPAFLVVVVLTTMIAVPWRARARELYHERRSWVWALILVASFAFATVWILKFRPDHAIIGAPDPRTTAEQIDTSLGYIPRRAGQLVGSIGWLDVPLPNFLVSIWLAVAAFIGFVALVLGTWRMRLALVVLTAGVILGPTIAEVPSASEYGLIWQGRYTLPIAFGLPILAGWTLHERRVDRAMVVRILGTLIVLACAAANVLAVAVALTDRQTGRAWPLAVELGPQIWSADVRGWVVLTVAGVGLAGLAVVLGALVMRRPDPPSLTPPVAPLEERIDRELPGAEPAVC